VGLGVRVDVGVFVEVDVEVIVGVFVAVILGVGVGVMKMNSPNSQPSVSTILIKMFVSSYGGGTEN
jgi:hypothetical protein